MPALDDDAVRATAARFATPRSYGNFINGQWCDTRRGRVLDLCNPATRDVVGHIARSSPADVQEAVRAARAAFPSWSGTPPVQRQRAPLAIADRLRQRRLDYAVLESLNNGKPVTEAYLHDVPSAIEQFEYFAGAAYHVKGDVADFCDTTVVTHRQAIGPVAQIIPWNVALLMASMKLAPALAAGCTVVLKPAESVCLSVLELIDDICDLLPPGVINVVTGLGAEVGEELVGHPDIRKVAFTGSRETARKILRYASTNIIPQTLELGGKSANIVCPDADVAAAAASVAVSTVVNKGEVCLAGSRVFVHDAVREEFLEHLHSMLAFVRQGDPLDPTTTLGAQASEAQFVKILDYIDIGRAEGATVFHGGNRATVPGFENGWFVQPTVFTDVRNDMRIAQEEIFGPVTSVIGWTDETAMLHQVNDTRYGLAGGVWTKDVSRAQRIARSMDTGTVWINRYFNLTPGQAIGGVKESGFGREGTLGTVLDHYTVQKVVAYDLQA
ncbi:aldehyde dehydrogenase family protein [Mycolicibacterium sp. 120266]|uniref:aldehyde dehydrogenase family protein n=1 Tax=Mycolicibacterium sp. 120266 TaxID=3090601 RepID=UPI00299D2C67|nr:aldehyde dehydrogenase family protein [Mycolicibacterium sp. 120266]MDX1872074.1 aldehyde dehydrogenase family protein [Mycolicibacterium sp. 120266]